MTLVIVLIESLMDIKRVIGSDKCGDFTPAEDGVRDGFCFSEKSLLRGGQLLPQRGSQEVHHLVTGIKKFHLDVSI